VEEEEDEDGPPDGAWTQHIVVPASQPSQAVREPLPTPADPDQPGIDRIIERTKIKLIELSRVYAGALHGPHCDRIVVWKMRMELWHALEGITMLLARSLLRYIASQTHFEPKFIPLSDQTFGGISGPFPALTYAAVTRLVGHPPTISPPRPCRDPTHAMKRNHEALGPMSGVAPTPELREPTWLERVRGIFDFGSPKGWRRKAPFHRDLLDWMDDFQLAGVDRELLKLWQYDIGHLMRPFMWIVPSLDQKKTLFRLAKATDGQHRPTPPRSRTVWHLPCQIMPSDEKLTSPKDMSPYPQSVAQVQTLCHHLHRHIDPFRHAQHYLVRHREITEMPSGAPQDEAWLKFDIEAVEAMWQFQNPAVGWVNPKRYHGSLVPLWTNDEQFPTRHWRGLRVRLDVYGARARGSVA
jgi:hypothetical protein